MRTARSGFPRRTRALLSVTALTAGLAVGWACADRAPSPDAVAVLGDREILYTDFAARVEEQTDSPAAALESPVLSRLLDQYLTECLVVQVATDRGIADAETDHRDALSALLASAPVEEPTEAELKARYQKETKRFTLPERVRLRQILVESREAAEEAKAELDRGEPFAEVARRHSQDPSAPFGGLQGELAYDDLPEEFADVIFALKPGEVSDVVEAAYGFHIFQVTAKLPGRVVPFSEAEPRLRREIRQEQARAWLDRLVEEAKSRYTVRVYERNLPFDYDGTYPTFGSPDAG